MTTLKKQKNRQSLIRKYNFLKKTSFTLINIGFVSPGYLILEYALSLALHYPFLDSYCDDEVEEFLARNNKRREYAWSTDDSNASRVVLYASRLIERGALTRQYFDYLVERNHEILLVLPTLHKSDIQTSLFRQAVEAPRVEIFVPTSPRRLNKIQGILEKVAAFKPYSVFIHMDPVDILGFMVFSRLKTPNRLYIVHNDHTFWLGKTCADYYIEFRNFGLALSIHRRKIPAEKLVLNKFYPILDNVEFLGLPTQVDGKIVGLIAGNLYKILLDADMTWLKIVVGALNLFDDLVIVIAGAGNAKSLMDFIARHKMENRILYLGHRSDFTELVKNVDLVLTTSPLTGGLVAQYASSLNKPIVGYTPLELFSVNEVKELFFTCAEPVLYTDKDSYLVAISEVIFKIRAKRDFTHNIPITKPLFEKNLDKLMQTLAPAQESEYVFIHDDDFYLNLYLNLRDGAKLGFIKYAIKRLINAVRSHSLTKEMWPVFRSEKFL